MKMIIWKEKRSAVYNMMCTAAVIMMKMTIWMGKRVNKRSCDDDEDGNLKGKRVHKCLILQAIPNNMLADWWWWWWFKIMWFGDDEEDWESHLIDDDDDYKSCWWVSLPKLCCHNDHDEDEALLLMMTVNELINGGCDRGCDDDVTDNCGCESFNGFSTTILIRLPSASLSSWRL